MERVIKRFRFPGSGRVVGMRQLSTEAVISAMTSYQREPVRMAYELAKRSLCEVDGVAIEAKGLDQTFASFAPREQALMIEAYNAIHNPTEEERAAFFASEEVEIAQG